MGDPLGYWGRALRAGKQLICWDGLATCKPLQIQNISYELVDFFGFRAPRRADADADVVVVNRSHGFKDVFAFQGLGLSSRKDDELLVRRADDEFFYPFLPEGLADTDGVFIGSFRNGKIRPVVEQGIEHWSPKIQPLARTAPNCFM